ARVRAVLRRTGSSPNGTESAVRRYGELVVDEGRREVSRGGRPLSLTRKEFDLLAFLGEHPGRTFTRQQLLAEVWDFAWDGDSSTVTVHVRRLREKIEDDPAVPRHLLTVWGVGYRFEP
ncbi:MAG: winged helix-turn-helix domain-containing protein, partial [Actinomycetes bacterium]